MIDIIQNALWAYLAVLFLPLLPVVIAAPFVLLYHMAVSKNFEPHRGKK